MQAIEPAGAALVCLKIGQTALWRRIWYVAIAYRSLVLPIAAGGRLH